MTEITCPTCGDPVVIGLPQDASVKSVETGDDSDVSTTDRTKTRVVRCPADHTVAVTFTVTVPDQSSQL
jgi:hypothetical protein